MIFVTKQDKDYLLHARNMAQANFSLRPKNEPFLVEAFSKLCESVVAEMVGSSDKVICKSKARPNTQKKKYNFREVDFHLPELNLIGEVKTSFSANNAFRSAQKQYRKLSEIFPTGYKVCYVIIDMQDTEAKPFQIDLNEEINILSGATLAEICEQKGLLKEGEYKAILSQERLQLTKKEADVYSCGNSSSVTIGDFLTFSLNAM